VGSGTMVSTATMEGLAESWIEPALRVVSSLLVVWYCAGMKSNERLFSGATAAVVSGALVFTFLEPLFSIVGIELAIVALYILVVAGSLVGLSLGVFLPTLFPGLVLALR